jgi:hypothetical protein
MIPTATRVPRPMTTNKNKVKGLTSGCVRQVGLECKRRLEGEGTYHSGYINWRTSYNSFGREVGH